METSSFDSLHIHVAADHAGMMLKEKVKTWLEENGHAVYDHGATCLDEDDDYPDFVQPAARAISESPEHMAIIFGGSGQGEAIAANRFPGVRAVVYYGEPARAQTDTGGEDLGIVASARRHNNANVLSVGARFVDEEEAIAAVRLFLETAFLREERHVRRLGKIETTS